jgi:heparin binding hemagglutinin HbhA
MAIAEDIVKTLKDPTPIYFLAGSADLAAEKLREVPPLIDKLRAEAPERFEKVRTADPKVVQEKVTAQAKDAQTKAQAKVADLVGLIDTDLKKLRDSAQDFALQQVGRAAEYAVKARETYDELAERGKGAVSTWRGETADQVEELAIAIEPESEPKASSSGTPAAEAPARPVPAAEKKTPPPPARKPAGKKPMGSKLGE